MLEFSDLEYTLWLVFVSSGCFKWGHLSEMTTCKLKGAFGIEVNQHQQIILNQFYFNS